MRSKRRCKTGERRSKAVARPAALSCSRFWVEKRPIRPKEQAARLQPILPPTLIPQAETLRYVATTGLRHHYALHPLQIAHGRDSGAINYAHWFGTCRRTHVRPQPGTGAEVFGIY